MCVMSLTWNRKRISAMPSRCDTVFDDRTFAPMPDSTSTTSESSCRRSSASM